MTGRDMITTILNQGLSNLNIYIFFSYITQTSHEPDLELSLEPNYIS